MAPDETNPVINQLYQKLVLICNTRLPRGHLLQLIQGHTSGVTQSSCVTKTENSITEERVVIMSLVLTETLFQHAKIAAALTIQQN